MAMATKVLRCSLIATVALALVGPTTALADTTTWLTPGGSKGFYEGKLTNSSFKFSYDGRAAKCEVVMWEETFIGALGNKLLPFQPGFTGCTTFPGELNVTITMHECSFLIHGLPTGPEGWHLGSTELSCPKGQQLEVVVYTGTTHKPENHLCTYTVKPQIAAEDLVFENRGNEGEPDEVWVSTTGLSLETTVDGMALLCGANGKEAQLFGTTKVRAWGEGGQTNLTVGHET